MDKLTHWHTINPSPEEMAAACEAFGRLPAMDVLPRLIVARRAVAAGFYTDDLRVQDADRPGSQPGDSER